MFLKIEATTDFREDEGYSVCTRAVVAKDAVIGDMIFQLADIRLIHATTLVEEETGDEVPGSILIIVTHEGESYQLATALTVEQIYNGMNGAQ